MKKPEIKETKGTFIFPKLKSSYWGPFSGLKSQDLIKASRTFTGVIFCPSSFQMFRQNLGIVIKHNQAYPLVLAVCTHIFKMNDFPLSHRAFFMKKYEQQLFLLAGGNFRTSQSLVAQVQFADWYLKGPFPPSPLRKLFI